MKSKLGKLNLSDLQKGFILTVIASLLASLLTIFTNNITIEFTWTFWQPTVYTAAVVAISYLLKNLGTNSEDKLLKGEQK